MEKTNVYFKNTYEESREVFRSHLQKIKQKWPDAELSTETIGQGQDNTIDMIYADATTSNNQVLFFTSGEHGIEGYAGAAMIHLFVEEYLDQVDEETTGICFIHALNPWGMKNFRRVNENNVDLNRNYLYDADSVPTDVNTHYAKESELFLPKGKIKDLDKERKKLYKDLGIALAKEGYGGLKEAKGMGQFQFPRGVYFGGSREEETTAFLKSIQRKLLGNFKRVIHMDWHTALGPTNEITMVVSENNPKEEKELETEYHLKNVNKFTPEKVKGDSTNHFYKLKKEEYPHSYLFTALFEFGTFGTSKKAELREFMTIILENHLYWEGAENEKDRKWILDEFKAMFYPEEEEWRESVLREGRNGIESVLTTERILPETLKK
ncbi:M14 family metallopeptidase [Halobacillus massiliensis]|uniref:M14 family metallopeptidase n=1 Tax=Halobacillus massiliensis TaxID=1926286 RepID=UPI0009E475F4|nr:M14 family metallopeptidase [Halobacillus massiliensis]